LTSAGDLRAYHKYMTQIAVLMGADLEAATKELDDVVKFEIRLANVIHFFYQIEHGKTKILAFRLASQKRTATTPAPFTRK
jgi:hypothetical protein